MSRGKQCVAFPKMSRPELSWPNCWSSLTDGEKGGPPQGGLSHGRAETDLLHGPREDLAADKHRRDEACELMVAANEGFPAITICWCSQPSCNCIWVTSTSHPNCWTRRKRPFSLQFAYATLLRCLLDLAFREEGREEAGKWLDVGLQAHPGNVELLAKKKKYYAGEDVSALDEELLATEAENSRWAARKLCG